MSAYCWRREPCDNSVAATTTALATFSDVVAKCHSILEAGIGAAVRHDEGRRQLTLIAYHLEKIASCIKATLATVD